MSIAFSQPTPKKSGQPLAVLDGTTVVAASTPSLRALKRGSTKAYALVEELINSDIEIAHEQAQSLGRLLELYDGVNKVSLLKPSN
jgi:hypothetical protein